MTPISGPQIPRNGPQIIYPDLIKMSRNLGKVIKFVSPFGPFLGANYTPPFDLPKYDDFRPLEMGISGLMVSHHEYDHIGRSTKCSNMCKIGYFGTSISSSYCARKHPNNPSGDLYIWYIYGEGPLTPYIQYYTQYLPNHYSK